MPGSEEDRLQERSPISGVSSPSGAMAGTAGTAVLSVVPVYPPPQPLCAPHDLRSPGSGEENPTVSLGLGPTTHCPAFILQMGKLRHAAAFGCCAAASPGMRSCPASHLAWRAHSSIPVQGGLLEPTKPPHVPRYLCCPGGLTGAACSVLGGAALFGLRRWLRASKSPHGDFLPAHNASEQSELPDEAGGAGQGGLRSHPRGRGHPLLWAPPAPSRCCGYSSSGHCPVSHPVPPGPQPSAAPRTPCPPHAARSPPAPLGAAHPLQVSVGTPCTHPDAVWPGGCWGEAAFSPFLLLKEAKAAERQGWGAAP